MRKVKKKTTETLKVISKKATSRYSIMVLSDPERGLKHISLPALAIPAVVVICLLGLIGGGASILGWTSSRVEQARMSDLQRENERLTGQLDEIRTTVEIFEAWMEENAAVERELRNLANLEPIPEEVRQLGVGGPPGFSELADGASPSPYVQVAREALTRLDELNRQADFQNSNFREMISALEESRETLDHLPSISPVRQGWCSSRYGTRKDPFTGRPTMHRGVDFSAWTGTPVYATANGTVRKAGKAGTLGLLVEIDHGNGVVTRYGHNSRILVKVGREVRRGDVIAEVGSTGRSTSPHCHYEVHVNGRHVNPWRYILDGGPHIKARA